MSQPLKSDDRTLQLDTRGGASNGGLNLDFLDLPDEAAGNLTVPATPLSTPSPLPPPAITPPTVAAPLAPTVGYGMGAAPPPPPAIPPSVPAFGQPSGPAFGGGGGGGFGPSSGDTSFGPSPAVRNPAPEGLAGAAQPTGISSITVFAGRSGADSGALRILKLFGLFVASFVVVGGAVFLFSGNESEESQHLPQVTQATDVASGNTSEKTPAQLEAFPAEEPSFIDTTFAFVMEMLGLAEEPPPMPEPVARKPKEKKAKALEPSPAPQVVADENLEGEADNVDSDLSDPYRIISNVLDMDAIDAVNRSRREISVTEREGWTAALSHKFPYQHYRAVEEMRGSRTNGSEGLLKVAMNDSRLWVRMQAAFALVESGVELTTSEVEKAIGRRERRGLLDGYFKRLVRSNNLAERYVMKFALPLVPETARVDILRGLVNAGDVDAELFVIAASFDQSKRVRRWATNWLAQHPSALLRMDEYREYLDAYGLTEKFKSAVATSVQGAESKRKRLEARTGADRPLTPPGIVTGKTTGSVLPSPNLPVDTNSAPVVGETPVEFYRVNN